MQKLERAYRAFVRGHDVARKATAESELFQALCKTAVEELGYRLAWVGLAADEGHRVVPVAQAGFEDGYLSSIEITWSDDPRGRGPTGTAIRERRTCVAKDIATDPRLEPWRADALRRGYASSAAIPLLDGTTRAIGALNLYAPEPDAFEGDAVALLEELATDLVLSLLHIRDKRRLEEMTAQLERAARAETASTVLAAVAHDLNNELLVASLSVADAREATDPAARAAVLEEAAHAIESAGSLMRQIMTLSRRSLGDVPRAKIDHVLGTLRPLLMRMAPHATVRVELQANGSTVALVPLDLERIVINLVVNATQAVKPGGHITVSTRLRKVDESGLPVHEGRLPGGEYVEVQVADDGTGIATEVLPHVFEPFFTTKGPTGTGLGLASVLTLARSAGGGVRVESDEGGSRFGVWLPSVRPTGSLG